MDLLISNLTVEDVIILTAVMIAAVTGFALGVYLGHKA